jgi:hypothetical protein
MARRAAGARVSGIRVRSRMNLRPLLDELDRIADLPNERAMAELDSVLHRGFAHTQAFVAIRTGNLKATGDVQSYEHERTYEGVIKYGGPQAFYAPFHFSRDGANPFEDDPLFREHEGQYAEAIDHILRHG